MVKVTASERDEFPKLAGWISSNLRLLADDKTVWPAFLAFTGLPPAWALDAVSGGIKSPTLAIGELGAKDSAFDPARPTEIWLAARLARAFEIRPTTIGQTFIGAAILTQVAAWSAFRTGKDPKSVALGFAGAAYPIPLDRSWLEATSDGGTFTIDLTASEIVDLIRITWAEARGEPRLGRAGVIFVVLNRVASTRFPNSVRAVIDAPGEFEPVKDAAGKSVAGLPAPGAADSEAISDIIEEIAKGGMQDPSNGATFFQNVRITQERGTEFASGTPPTAVIGRHSFFDRYKANDPVKVARWRLTTPASRAATQPAPTAGVVL
jgi:hypothetical protein